LSRETLREIALAGVAGLVIAVSPLTPNEAGPSALAGLLTGAAVLGVRWFRRSRRSEATPQDGADASAEAAAPAAPFPWLLCAAGLVYLGVFTLTFRWLYQSWTASIWINNHGIFVPFVVAYLIHGILKHDDDPEPDASPWGFAFLAFGLALAAADAAIRSGYLGVVGLVATFPGLSLLLLGRKRTRALLVPLAVSLLMIPIPNSVASHLYLRRATAAVVEPLLHFLGYPAFLEGTVIVMPDHTFVVSDACSGFSTLYAAVAVSIILACYCRSNWRRLLLLLLAAPLALASNIVRVLILVLLTNWFGRWVLDTAIHEASGVATYAVILFGMFAIADRRTLREELA